LDTPVIEIPRNDIDIGRAHRFHLDHAGSYILPRTAKEFVALAKEDRALWMASDGTGVLAVCYVRADEDDAQRAEFGGVVVHPERAKKVGLASALGTVAISHYALMGMGDRPELIAHVHVDNDKPHRLLTEHLGFVWDANFDKQVPKAVLEAAVGAPVNLPADATGMICGRGLRFERPMLKVFADRLLNDRLAKCQVTIGNRYFAPDALAETVQLLHELA
jgi:hypothetical protein